jgi:hypothetical protein
MVESSLVVINQTVMMVMAMEGKKEKQQNQAINKEKDYHKIY